MKKGKLSHFILTTEQLEENLKLINNSLEENESMLEHRIVYELYDTIKLKYAITHDKIIFEIDFPIHKNQ